MRPPARLRPCADGADRAPRCRDGGARARALRQAGRRWGIGLRRKNETRLFFFFCCCSESKTTRGDLRKQRLRSRIICRPTLGRIPLWAYLFWHGFSRLYSSIAFAIAAPAATVSSPFLVGIRDPEGRRILFLLVATREECRARRRRREAQFSGAGPRSHLNLIWWTWTAFAEPFLVGAGMVRTGGRSTGVGRVRFSLVRNSKTFQNFTSHQILWHMH